MDEQGEGDGAGPGAIAAELENGDTKRTVLWRGEPSSSKRSGSNGAASKIWQLRRRRRGAGGAGAVPSRHGRELFVPPCHWPATTVNYKHSHSNKHHHSQGGAAFALRHVAYSTHAIIIDPPPFLPTRMGLFFAAGDPTGLWVWLARHHPQRQFDLPTATTSVQGCMCMWVPGYLGTLTAYLERQGAGGLGWPRRQSSLLSL